MRAALSFVPILAALLLTAPLLLAWTPRKPILHGASALAENLAPEQAYVLARAEAWLQALQMARARSGQNPRLIPLGLGGSLGGRAICSRLHPLDVFTPESAGSATIRVFLKDDSEAGDLDAILREPEQILLAMCRIWETENAAAKMRALLAEAPEKDNAAALAQEAALLRALWPGEDAVNTRSATLLLQKAQAENGGDAGQDAANAATKILLARLVESPQTAPVWNRLAAWAIYLRGLGLERQDQPALAEADYSAALARLKKDNFLDDLTPKTLLARASLRGRMGNIQGMCADSEAACSLGECGALARARRNGLCPRSAP